MSTADVSDVIEQATSAAQAAINAFEQAASLKDLEALRVQFLSKKSDINQLSRSLKTVAPENRREVGQAINAAKKSVENALESKKATLSESDAGDAADAPTLDVTLPGIRTCLGRRHPIMTTMEEIKSILVGLGFRYDDYPEVETEAYNFDALNTPDWHPARDSHDTFYTESDRLLRTHTSAFQTRAMKSFGAPLRAMTSGRCYRCDTIDASHYPIFHQLDAIAIDRDISFADLKWTLYSLARALFGEDVELRFRPSYFPFTTPSAEVDVLFQGKWLEILGAGMMHPNVLRNGGLDPEEWQGFAFGLGVDRMTMIRHGIDDIRYLYDNEESFLRQF